MGKHQLARQRTEFTFRYILTIRANGNSTGGTEKKKKEVPFE